MEDVTVYVSLHVVNHQVLCSVWTSSDWVGSGMTPRDVHFVCSFTVTPANFLYMYHSLQKTQLKTKLCEVLQLNWVDSRRGRPLGQGSVAFAGASINIDNPGDDRKYLNTQPRRRCHSDPGPNRDRHVNEHWLSVVRAIGTVRKDKLQVEFVHGWAELAYTELAYILRYGSKKHLDYCTCTQLHVIEILPCLLTRSLHSEMQVQFHPILM